MIISNYWLLSMINFFLKNDYYDYYQLLVIINDYYDYYQLLVIINDF